MTCGAQIVVLLIMCSGHGFSGVEKYRIGSQAQSEERQLKQATVMLKSVALFSTSATADCPLKLVIFSDPMRLYDTIKEQLDTWPLEHSQKFQLTPLPVYYPEGLAELRGHYRLCSTARRFYPWALKQDPSFAGTPLALDLDSDVILLQPVEQLWSHFDQFTEKNLLSMAECGDCHYKKGRRQKFPFPGETGYNSGVLNLNLTRIENFSEDHGWIRMNKAIWDQHKGNISWVHQDMVNIACAMHPEILYTLPCEANLRAHTVELCLERPDQTIGMLHGAGYTFAKTPMDPISWVMTQVFQSFLEHDMASPLAELVAMVNKRMLATLTKWLVMTKAEKDLVHAIMHTLKAVA